MSNNTINNNLPTPITTNPPRHHQFPSSSSPNTTTSTTTTPSPTTTPEQELPRILEALHIIFQPPPPSSHTLHEFQTTQSNANRYLTEFQRMTIAWPVCDRLLNDVNPGSGNNNNSTETHFFAAQTIHAKCRADILQLGEGDLPGLRDSLMSHLLRFCTTTSTPGSGSNAPIVTRLAMALCTLAVQMDWISVLSDILSDFQQQQQPPPPRGKMQLALEICSLLPEEATSNRLLPRRGENQRDCFLTVLRESSGTVLEFLGFCVRGGGGASTTTMGGAGVGLKIRETALRCLHSWIRYVNIPPRIFVDSPLLEWVFTIVNGGSGMADGVGGGDTFELAVDVIIELLRRYPSTEELNMALVHKMVPCLMTLSTPPPTPPTAGLGTTTTTKSAFHTALETEDEDGIRAFCRIYSEMGEAYMSLIMSHENLNQVALVDLVLACSAIPVHDIANITLNFWYRFVTSIETISPYEYRQYTIDNFQPQLTTLVTTCITTLLRYPPDLSTLPPDLLDETHRHRSYVCDTLEDCCRLLGGNCVLGIVGGRLEGECRRLQQVVSVEGKGLEGEWEAIEACLMGLIAASRYAPDDEGQILPLAVSILPSLVVTTTAANANTNGGAVGKNAVVVAIPPLCNTINALVGSYASWFDKHTAQLQQILPLLSTTMADRRCASSAALAIRDLCRSSCSNSLSSSSSSSSDSSNFLSGDVALQWYEEIIAGSLLEGILRDELQVLEGVCVAITRYLRGKKGEDVGVYLSRIVGPIGRRLEALTVGERAGSGTPRMIGAELERMTVVVDYLDLYDPPVAIPPMTMTAPGGVGGMDKENQGGGSGGNGPSAARSRFLLDLAGQTWPYLEAAITRHPNDVYLAEKLCRLHKHLLRRCGPVLYRGRLGPLRDHLVAAFARSHLSPYLYMASVCIGDFAEPSSSRRDLYRIPSNEYAQSEIILSEMLRQMSQITFSFLRTSDDFQSNPDVIEEFFFMGSKMVQSCPVSFVGNNNNNSGGQLLNAYLQCAVVGLDLDHRDANRGVLNFLEMVVLYGVRLKESSSSGGGGPTTTTSAEDVQCRQCLERAVMTEGKHIVTKLLRALCGNLPCYRIIGSGGSIGGILYGFQRLLAPGLLANWFTEALATTTLDGSGDNGGGAGRLGELAKEGMGNLLEAMGGGVAIGEADFFEAVRRFAEVCDRRRRMGRR